MKTSCLLTISTTALITLSFSFNSFASEFDSFDGSIPIVLTPTRLRQSLADVPASVTIITSEMLERFGIKSIPDALRLVPGMAITQVTGSDFRINYHGTNILVPRRLNVLIDGISMYRPAFSRVDWKELPVAIENIDKIEVTRGPNSASYGPNSMLAIINIITKIPLAVEGTLLSLTGGSLKSADGLMRHAGSAGDSTTYRVTFERKSDSGFDFASSTGVGHDSTKIDKVNFRSVTEMGQDENFDFQASIVQGTKESEYIDAYQATFPDVKLHDYFLNATWNKGFSDKHELKIQSYVSDHKSAQPWRTCVPTAFLLPEMYALWKANSKYATTIAGGKIPKGGTAKDDALAAAAYIAITALGKRAKQPTCVDADQNYIERRFDVDIQDTYVFSNTLRMVNGAGFRRDIGISQSYLAGEVSNDSWRVFSNVEYKPAKKISINAGGFFEKDTITGASFSPRIALNYHLNENNTIRFVASRATRMPDIEEQSANWSYRTTNYSTPLNGSSNGHFFQSAKSPGAVTGEKILSKEIGYLGNFPKYGLLLDVKLFEDQLTSLISEKLQLSDYAPTNSNSAQLRGSEMQISYEPTDRLMVHVAYSYLENDASIIQERTQYARNSGAAGISYSFNNTLQMSLALYQFGGNTASQSYYGKEDLTITKLFRLGNNTNLTSAFVITHLDNRSSRFLVDTNRVRESSFNDSMQYAITMKLSF